MAGGTQRDGEKIMKRIEGLAIVMLIFNVVSAFGQSRAEIEAKFGQPVNAYSVSETIWMSPEYGSDGQVCRMIFYPRRFSSTTNFLTTELSFDEFRSVIDAILPDPLRGARKEPFGNGSWIVGGGARWATFVYERVTISYAAGFRIAPTRGMGEPVNLEDEIPKLKEKSKAVKEDFSRYSDSTAEMAIVQWKDRKCLGKL
jgi:hypothetical protein